MSNANVETNPVERLVMRICNRAHLCVKAAKCPHAKPHSGKCGPAMPCYDDPSGEISRCVKVTNGKFETHHRDTCQHCHGRGHRDRIEQHDA